MRFCISEQGSTTAGGVLKAFGAVGTLLVRGRRELGGCGAGSRRQCGRDARSGQGRSSWRKPGRRHRHPAAAGRQDPAEAFRTPRSRSMWCPQQLLQDQAVTRLEDALKNVPGVTLNAGEGAARGDTINIRGFSAFNDFFLDGVRDAAVYVRDPFNLRVHRGAEGPVGDAVRPRLDRRRGQPGQQGAAADAARRADGRHRDQRRIPRHARHQPADRPQSPPFA